MCLMAYKNDRLWKSTFVTFLLHCASDDNVILEDVLDHLTQSLEAWFTSKRVPHMVRSLVNNESVHVSNLWKCFWKCYVYLCLNLTFIYEFFKLSIAIDKKKSINCVTSFDSIQATVLTQKNHLTLQNGAGCCMYPCDFISNVTLWCSQLNDWFISILSCTLKPASNISVS